MAVRTYKQVMLAYVRPLETWTAQEWADIGLELIGFQVWDMGEQAFKRAAAMADGGNTAATYRRMADTCRRHVDAISSGR